MADIRTILASNANSSLMKKRKEKHQAAAVEENRAIEIKEEKEEAVESLMKAQPSFSFSVRDSGEVLYGMALGDFPLSDNVMPLSGGTLSSSFILKYTKEGEEEKSILSGLTEGGVALGLGAEAASSMSAIAIGKDAQALSSYSIALGHGAEAEADGAVQIGEGSNSNANTLKFRDYEIVGSDGKIPTERIQNSLSVYALEQEVQASFDNIGSQLSNEINPKISAIADEVSAEVRRMDELSGKVEGLSGTVVSDYALKTEIPLSVGQLVNDKNYVTSSDLDLLKVLKYKGTKQTFDELPPDDENQIGDVWNVVEAHGENPAGTNYAWSEDSTWDPLGGSIDVSVFAKNDAVVHLSGNEVLSGRLSADFFHHIDNPLCGMVVAEIGTNVSAILDKRDSNASTYVGAMLYGESLSVAINIKPYSEIPDIVIEHKNCESWINDWIDLNANERYSSGEFLYSSTSIVGELADGRIEIYASYNPNDPGGEYSFEEIYSNPTKIKDMLIDVATGNMEPPTDGQRVLLVEWYVRDGSGNVILRGKANDGQILDTRDPVIEALYHLQTNQYLSAWTDHDEFALTSEIKEATSPLSAAIEKALTAEIDPKFTTWKNSINLVAGKESGYDGYEDVPRIGIYGYKISAISGLDSINRDFYPAGFFAGRFINARKRSNNAGSIIAIGDNINLTGNNLIVLYTN